MKKIDLTKKELARRDVIHAFNLGHVTRVSAAEQLAVTVRQLHILRKRYRYQGDEGLIDRRRFTKGNFCKPAHLKAQVMGLIRVDYAGLGPTAVCRKLASECGLTLHLATVRLWMTKAGIPTARRNSYQVSETGRAAQVAKPDLSTDVRSQRLRNRCLPPRLYREHLTTLPVDCSADARAFLHAPEHAITSAMQNDDDRRSSQDLLQHDQPDRTPSLAELDELFAAQGTSAEALDELVVTFAIQLMEKLGRPVTEDEISAYIDEREPHLQPLLGLIDAARAADKERRNRRGKRLTLQQRQAILVMLHQGIRGSVIARTFDITPGAITGYKRQLRAMDEEDHAGAFNITRFRSAI